MLVGLITHLTSFMAAACRHCAQGFMAFCDAAVLQACECDEERTLCYLSRRLLGAIRVTYVIYFGTKRTKLSMLGRVAKLRYFLAPIFDAAGG